MIAPEELTGHARDYWDRHAGPLAEAGILTERDRDSFALLCRIWGLLQDLDTTPAPENYRAMIQFVNLSKQYQSLRPGARGPTGSTSSQVPFVSDLHGGFLLPSTPYRPQPVQP